MALCFAIALYLLMTSCVATRRRTQGEQDPTVPIKISAGRSLLVAAPPQFEGVFSYCAVSYHVEIDGCAAGYAGPETVQDLTGGKLLPGLYGTTRETSGGVTSGVIRTVSRSI